MGKEQFSGKSLISLKETLKELGKKLGLIAIGLLGLRWIL